MPSMNTKQRTNVEAIAVAMALAGLVMMASGRTVVVLAGDPNTCEQSDYRSTCPLAGVTDLDPSAVILGPVPNDPNAWSVPAGWWRRSPGRACDPDAGDAIVSVTAVSWSTSIEPKILYDPNAGTWSIEALIEGGTNAFGVRALDQNGGQRDVIVGVEGINTNPVLY